MVIFRNEKKKIVSYIFRVKVVNIYLALRALLGISSDPVGRLRIVIALLDPGFEERAADGFMPIFAAREAENVSTLALDWTNFRSRRLHAEVAIRLRTPTHQAIALKIRAVISECRFKIHE